ncbi:MAG: hypothetical protein PHU08_00345 [Dehalococcoidales bacterium]|nr:hypothetical protein [Dehalococcoidales bacterium]
MKYLRIVSISLASIIISLILLMALAVPAMAQTVSLSSTSGVVGTSVSVTGSGFTPSVAFHIHFAFGTIFESVTSGTVTAGGTINAAFNVTPAPTGSYIVRVETSGTNFANATFTVVPGITLDKASAYVGDQLIVTGTGFMASRAITIRFDTAAITTAASNASGSFTGTFTIPAAVASSHTVTATDNSNSASASFSVLSSVSLSPTSGIPDTVVTVSGNGFRASRTIVITYNGTTIATTPSSVATGTTGSFSATFRVPTTANRSPVVTATDGLYSASAIFQVLATTSVTPTSGGAGTRVTVNGSGFLANQRITLAWDGTNISTTPSTITSTSTGTFTATFNVPTSPGGTHVLRASDGTNATTLNFVVLTNLAISPASGPVGGNITINGTGYGASRPVEIEFDNSPITTIPTEANGSFTASISTPASATGNHTIRVSDGTYSASATFATTPRIEISRTSGQINASVNILGTGFGARRPITVRFGNVTVKTATSDANGSFSDKFEVPELDIGNYTVSASDGASSATAIFDITVSVGLSASTGSVGTSITITGKGFRGTITIKYDDTVVASTTADASGGFSATFNAPPSIHGIHGITASDATQTLRTTFTMESQPPPAPVLSVPEEGATVGSKATFEWQPVADPSGVSYTLQIALDAAFQQTVLNKPNLPTTRYTLDKTEELPALRDNAAYYWRVRAIDGASNASNWSAIRAFTVSVFPDWAKYTLIGMGALLVLALVFWIGIRVGRGGAKA